MKTINTVTAAPGARSDETVAFVGGYPYGVRYAIEEAPYRPYLWEVFTPNMSFFTATQDEARFKLLDELSMTENVEWASPRPDWTLPDAPIPTALAASNAAVSEPAPAASAEAPILSTAFAPLPIGPYTPAMDLPEGQGSNYGRCSKFCTTGHYPEGTPEAMEVAEHGPWCESQTRGYVHGFSELGSRREGSASLVRRYLHGTYDYPGRVLHQQPDMFVRIEVYEQDKSVFLFLPIGEAYRLCAALTELARSADSLDVSLDAMTESRNHER